MTEVPSVSRRALARRLCRQVSRLLFIDQWNVGIVRAPIHEFLGPDFAPPIHWLPAGKAWRYKADPFPIVHHDGLTVLFEEYDYLRLRGRISAVEVRNGGASPARCVIDNGKHMSYPFTLRHDGRVYIIPETWDRRELSAYAFDARTASWERAATLLQDVPAVDATPCEYASRW